MYSIANGLQVLLLLPCDVAQDSLTHHYIPEDESSSAVIVLHMFLHSIVLKFTKLSDPTHCIFAISGWGNKNILFDLASKNVRFIMQHTLPICEECIDWPQNSVSSGNAIILSKRRSKNHASTRARNLFRAHWNQLLTQDRLSSS
jgi:hypothetical protein